MATIGSVIEAASKEFQKDGRSEKFLKIENRVYATNNPLFVFYFARYARGADIKRAEDFMLENANLEQCYYFKRGVHKASLTKFVEKAIAENDLFWVNKLLELHAPKKEKAECVERAKEANLYIDPETVSETSPEKLLENAKQYFFIYGSESMQFKEVCKQALYSNAHAESRIFAREVRGVDLKDFERVALWIADPQHMYLLAFEIPEINAKLMISGINMAKLDYKKLDDESKIRRARVAMLEKKIEECVDEGELAALRKAHREAVVSNTSDYLATIDNYYLASLNWKRKQDKRF